MISAGSDKGSHHLDRIITRVLKRSLDVVAACVGLVLLSPLFLALALIIKRSNSGPVFFRQQRVGQHGQLFLLFKFRSMRTDAEAVLKADVDLWNAYVSNDFKLPEGQDPRITPIGRVLRRTSLDELPQLWNVLRGEMSLVGPRPLIHDELDTWYGERADELLSVKPGMTGLWQVSGRSSIGYPERADLELSYVRALSLWLDVKILFMTVAIVLNGKGAH